MNSDDLLIGIHSGHDANVTVFDSIGQVLFAAGEERFNREKMYAGFPEMALKYALDKFGTRYHAVAVPRMPFSGKIIRELKFFIHSFSKGLVAPRFTFWLIQGGLKLFKGRGIEQGVQKHAIKIEGPSLNVEHHLAHAASAFYPSGFKKAYVLTLDGEGDGYSCCLFKAHNDSIDRIHSWYHNELTVGRDYEKITAMLGFHPVRHPGKITGLAAYGKRNEECIDKIQKYLEASWKSGWYKMLSRSQAYQIMLEEGRNELIRDRTQVFGKFSKEDIAYAIQFLTEHRVIEIIEQYIPDRNGADIALAGGVFANVTLNKKIKNLGFNRIFIQPAMTDCGLSLGAALYHAPFRKSIQGFNQVFFGTSFTPDEIRKVLIENNQKYTEPEDIASEAARMLADGYVIARFDGAMEFGPRALGNRSILYHAKDPSVNGWLNHQLRRTEFMPFAPVTLERFSQQYYLGYEGAERTSKFMTITFDCTEKMRRESPAVVHVDNTARPQILMEQDNPGYAAILEAYYKATGIPTLVNTSFNMHEEPIVMTPRDAVRAFIASNLDALIAGPFLVKNPMAKKPQHPAG